MDRKLKEFNGSDSNFTELFGAFSRFEKECLDAKLLSQLSQKADVEL